MASREVQELLQRKEALEREIEAAQKRERADAIAKVRALMSEYGLTLADLGGKAAPAPARAAAGKVPPKYRNTKTGETWSGRGLQPNWLKAALAGGARLDDFKL